MAEFTPGLDLAARYYAEAVAPAVTELLPGIGYAAGLIGDGSEVQRFDSARSMDHDWGPRVLLFFSADAIEHARTTLLAGLPALLGAEFAGHSTRFHRGDKTEATGPYRMGSIVAGVEIHQPAEWVRAYLGIDPRESPAVADWLVMPWTLLRGATGGDVFRDDIGEITAIRSALTWYPEDIWRYVVACQWQRINQEEPFIGRNVEIGAEVGSRLIVARQLREVMHLCHLLERRYPPYTKWLDTSFCRLDCAAAMYPLMLAAVGADDADEREALMSDIYVRVAELHNDSGVSQPESTVMERFHDRPYAVLNSYRFVAATQRAITDESIRALPLHGCISQCVDSTDVLASGGVARHFRAALEGASG